MINNIFIGQHLMMQVERGSKAAETKKRIQEHNQLSNKLYSDPVEPNSLRRRETQDTQRQ